MEKILIYYGKVANEKREESEWQEKRKRVMEQQDAIKEESENKRKVLIRKLQEK